MTRGGCEYVHGLHGYARRRNFLPPNPEVSRIRVSTTLIRVNPSHLSAEVRQRSRRCLRIKAKADVNTYADEHGSRRIFADKNYFDSVAESSVQAWHNGLCDLKQVALLMDTARVPKAESEKPLIRVHPPKSALIRVRIQFAKIPRSDKRACIHPQGSPLLSLISTIPAV